VCLLFSLVFLACTSRPVDSGAKRPSTDRLPAAEAGPAIGKELIPAEWTVFEDTSATGEVTTASLQLPAAQDIEGLLDQEGPRLVLRCVDGKVQASIDTERSDSVASVAIQLDSVPACE
jgi:hypothetical protein